MIKQTSIITPDVISSKGKRFANFLIDYVVQIIFGFVVGVVITLFAELTGSYGLYEAVIETESRISDYIFGIVILLIYYVFIETVTKGRSIGKYITKTKVVLEDGTEPTFNKVLVRTLCRLIPFDAFSFLGEGTGWHDSIPDTIVVDIDKFEAKKNSSTEIDLIGVSEED